MGSVTYSRRIQQKSLAQFLREYFEENSTHPFVWYMGAIHIKTGFLGLKKVMVGFPQGGELIIYGFQKELGAIAEIYAKTYDVNVEVILVNRL